MVSTVQCLYREVTIYESFRIVLLLFENPHVRNRSSITRYAAVRTFFSCEQVSGRENELNYLERDLWTWLNSSDG